MALVLKASRVQVSSDEYSLLPLLHRVAIADAPPEKQPEIAKAVVEKKLTEEETRTLVQAMNSPFLTGAYFVWYYI